MSNAPPPGAGAHTTLAGGTSQHVLLRWELRASGEDLVLAPRPSGCLGRVLLVLLFVLIGGAWSVVMHQFVEGPMRFTGYLGVPVMAVTAALVLYIHHVMAAAEIHRGPSLTYSAAADTIALPRKNLTLPRDAAVRLELFRGWRRGSRVIAYTRHLDLIVRRPDGVTDRHTVLMDVTRLASFAAALSQRLRIPLERMKF